MKNILFLTSSALSDTSQSAAIAAELVAGLTSRHPGAQVVERRLDSDAIPHLSGDVLKALGTPAEKRTPDQIASVALADQLIAEIEAADAIVIASPMYNFTITTPLKAWLDHVARAGRTFRYTEKGPVGLLNGKQAFIVASRGGIYSQGPAAPFDFQTPYLRHMLGFLGITDVELIPVEGLRISPEMAAQGMAQARQIVAKLTEERHAA